MEIQLEPGLSRFRNAALSFCEFIDSAPNLAAESFLIGVEARLLELYASALWLPAVVLDSPDGEDRSFPIDDWSAIFERLRENLGKYDRYWTIFDSTVKSAPVDGSQASNISEIYSDIKEALELLSKSIPDASL